MGAVPGLIVPNPAVQDQFEFPTPIIKYTGPNGIPHFPDYMANAGPETFKNAIEANNKCKGACVHWHGRVLYADKTNNCIGVRMHPNITSYLSQSDLADIIVSIPQKLSPYLNVSQIFTSALNEKSLIDLFIRIIGYNDKNQITAEFVFCPGLYDTPQAAKRLNIPPEVGQTIYKAFQSAMANKIQPDFPKVDVFFNALGVKPLQWTGFLVMSSPLVVKNPQTIIDKYFINKQMVALGELRKVSPSGKEAYVYGCTLNNFGKQSDLGNMHLFLAKPLPPGVKPGQTISINGTFVAPMTPTKLYVDLKDAVVAPITGYPPNYESSLINSTKREYPNTINSLKNDMLYDDKMHRRIRSFITNPQELDKFITSGITKSLSPDSRGISPAPLILPGSNSPSLQTIPTVTTIPPRPVVKPPVLKTPTADNQEKERLEKERLEKERLEKERLEQERIEAEKKANEEIKEKEAARIKQEEEEAKAKAQENEAEKEKPSEQPEAEKAPKPEEEAEEQKSVEPEETEEQKQLRLELEAKRKAREEEDRKAREEEERQREARRRELEEETDPDIKRAMEEGDAEALGSMLMLKRAPKPAWDEKDTIADLISAETEADNALNRMAALKAKGTFNNLFEDVDKGLEALNNVFGTGGNTKTTSSYSSADNYDPYNLYGDNNTTSTYDNYGSYGGSYGTDTYGNTYGNNYGGYDSGSSYSSASSYTSSTYGNTYDNYGSSNYGTSYDNYGSSNYGGGYGSW